MRSVVISIDRKRKVGFAGKKLCRVHTTIFSDIRGFKPQEHTNLENIYSCGV